jgi:hypothetical protein
MFNDLHSELSGEAGTDNTHSVILLRLAFRGYSQALQPRIGRLAKEYVVYVKLHAVCFGGREGQGYVLRGVICPVHIRKGTEEG